MEEPRAGACSGDKLVAVFDGVGVVYPVWLWENQTARHTVVFHQDLSEFPGCVGRVAAGAVAETNYYNVRQSYRTCTNYRILYQRRSFGSIINYEKCESSLTLNIRYDDGFVAYINGRHLTRDNFKAPVPEWNDDADGLHDDADAVILQPFRVNRDENPDVFNDLQVGDNILAIHGLNDSTGSSDFLISLELHAGN